MRTAPDLCALRERYQSLLNCSGVLATPFREFLACDVPALLAEVERLRAELAEAHKLREVTERRFFESQARTERVMADYRLLEVEYASLEMMMEGME